MRCGGQTGFTKFVANLTPSYKDAWPFGFHLGSVPFVDKKRNSIKLIKFRLSKPPGLENGRFLNSSWLLISHLCLRVSTHPSTQMSGKNSCGGRAQLPETAWCPSWSRQSTEGLGPSFFRAVLPNNSSLPGKSSQLCPEIRVGAGAPGLLSALLVLKVLA